MMINMTTIWIQSYAIFWLIFSGYYSVKHIIKITTEKNKRDTEDIKKIDELKEALSKLAEVISNKAMSILIAFIIVFAAAIDILGYFLVYAYVPLEGSRLMIFFFASFALLLFNVTRIWEFSKIIKHVMGDISSQEIVKFMNKYFIIKTLFTLLISVASLIYALQLVLWSIF